MTFTVSSTSPEVLLVYHRKRLYGTDDCGVSHNRVIGARYKRPYRPTTDPAPTRVLVDPELYADALTWADESHQAKPRTVGLTPLGTLNFGA